MDVWRKGAGSFCGLIYWKLKANLLRQAKGRWKDWSSTDEEYSLGYWQTLLQFKRETRIPGKGRVVRTVWTIRILEILQVGHSHSEIRGAVWIVQLYSHWLGPLSGSRHRCQYHKCSSLYEQLGWFTLRCRSYWDAVGAKNSLSLIGWGLSGMFSFGKT